MTIEERAERCLIKIAEIKESGSSAQIEDMKAALDLLGVKDEQDEEVEA